MVFNLSELVFSDLSFLSISYKYNSLPLSFLKSCCSQLIILVKYDRSRMKVFFRLECQIAKRIPRISYYNIRFLLIYNILYKHMTGRMQLHRFSLALSVEREILVFDAIFHSTCCILKDHQFLKKN